MQETSISQTCVEGAFSISLREISGHNDQHAENIEHWPADIYVLSTAASKSKVWLLLGGLLVQETHQDTIISIMPAFTSSLPYTDQYRRCSLAECSVIS